MTGAVFPGVTQRSQAGREYSRWFHLTRSLSAVYVWIEPKAGAVCMRTLVSESVTTSLSVWQPFSRSYCELDHNEFL